MTDEQEALREALKRTAVALKQGKVGFALGGGYAGWALGGPEPEHDVDFVVAERDQEHAARVLQDAGLQIERPPEDWLFEVFFDGAMVNVIHRIGGVPVEHELLDRAVDTEVLSVRMPVLAATDLLPGKTVALSSTRATTARCCRLHGRCASRSTGTACARWSKATRTQRRSSSWPGACRSRRADRPQARMPRTGLHRSAGAPGLQALRPAPSTSPDDRPAPRARLPPALSWRSSMRALSVIRTAPVRAAVRLQTMQADDREAGMTTAEYAVGTVGAAEHDSMRRSEVACGAMISLWSDQHACTTVK